MDQVGTTLRLREQLQVRVQPEAAALEKGQLLVARPGKRGAERADRFGELLALGFRGTQGSGKKRPSPFALCGRAPTPLAGGSPQIGLTLRRGLRRHLEEVAQIGRASCRERV